MGRGTGREKAGYRIIRLVFEGNSAREEVFLSGCEVNGEVICRPVDILEAPDGRLFVSDDYAGAVYTISQNALNCPQKRQEWANLWHRSNNKSAL